MTTQDNNSMTAQDNNSMTTQQDNNSSISNNRRGKVEGHVAIIAANVIFGLGVPVSSYLLRDWVTPNVYMASRCVGAALIFWALSLWMPRERVAGRDLLVIVLSGLLGFVVSQTLTAWALVYTTPVYYSLIATLTPVATMILAALFLGEGITGMKAAGVLLGIGGAALMVVLKWQDDSGSNDLLGIFFALMSLLTWAVYLIVTRKVSQRYSALTQMKWVFLASSVVVLPYTLTEFGTTRLYGGPVDAEWLMGMAAMLFIVVFATVVGYFMIPFAMKYLKATTVSVYTNLQPIVASFVAIALAQDTLTWDKPVAAVLVMVGAYLVTSHKKD